MSPISIVGAGPGALDLMTIRAHQRLKTADVLVWTDSLIPLQIANLVKEVSENLLILFFIFLLPKNEL